MIEIVENGKSTSTETAQTAVIELDRTARDCSQIDLRRLARKLADVLEYVADCGFDDRIYLSIDLREDEYNDVY